MVRRCRLRLRSGCAQAKSTWTFSMVKVIIGVSIVIGTIFLFGPVGLAMLIPLVLVAAWIFSPSDKEANEKHRREVDAALSGFFGHKK